MFDPALFSNLSEAPDDIAPDGSEIRLVQSTVEGSSMVHTLLHPGTTTYAVYHLTVQEIWLCLRGEGELWRKDAEEESVLKLVPGTTCDIPLGTTFQFRTTSDVPLEIGITTTPSWPGNDEAVRIKGKWTPST